MTHHPPHDAGSQAGAPAAHAGAVLGLLQAIAVNSCTEPATMNEANDTLHTIEDAAKAALNRPCRHFISTIDDDGRFICVTCGRDVDA